MICGYCKEPGWPGSDSLLWHWRLTGCNRHRPVWVRVIEARKRGSSGHRILHEAFPDLYPSEPMPEEVKQQLAELTARRKEEGVKIGKQRRRGRK